MPELRIWLGVIAVLAVLPHVPGLDSDFGRSLLSQMGIAAVFALSYNVLFGQTGLLSFGHAVYFGLGGYVAIHLMRAINHGLPAPDALRAARGCGRRIAVRPPVRRGDDAAGRHDLRADLARRRRARLRRDLHAAGLFRRRGRHHRESHPGPALFGLDLGSQLAVYYLIALWALLAAALMQAFARTPVGRMCNAVRDNPERAEFVGYNTHGVRFFAFAVAALFAGLAGGLHAINYEIVAADAVSAQRSGTVLLMAYIGGAGHFAGPILGAVTLTWLQTSLSGYTSAWLLYLGLFFMVIILFAPSGLVGLDPDARPDRPHPGLSRCARAPMRSRSCPQWSWRAAPCC